MSERYGIDYEGVAWRKGGLYQGFQSLINNKREVVWRNSVATFGDTNSDIYGHEFGHIIQAHQQGWATFQGTGIMEQLFLGASSYLSRQYNEGGAEWMLQQFGGCTVFDSYGNCIKL